MMKTSNDPVDKRLFFIFNQSKKIKIRLQNLQNTFVKKGKQQLEQSISRRPPNETKTSIDQSLDMQAATDTSHLGLQQT